MSTAADPNVCASEREESELRDQEDRRVDYLPTSREISRACARIRSEWTLNEQRRRFVGELIPDEATQDWRPPVIDTSAFQLAISAGRESA